MVTEINYEEADKQLVEKLTESLGKLRVVQNDPIAKEKLGSNADEKLNTNIAKIESLLSSAQERRQLIDQEFAKNGIKPPLHTSNNKPDETPILEHDNIDTFVSPEPDEDEPDDLEQFLQTLKRCGVKSNAALKYIGKQFFKKKLRGSDKPKYLVALMKKMKIGDTVITNSILELYGEIPEDLGIDLEDEDSVSTGLTSSKFNQRLIKVPLMDENGKPVLGVNKDTGKPELIYVEKTIQEINDEIVLRRITGQASTASGSGPFGSDKTLLEMWQRSEDRNKDMLAKQGNQRPEDVLRWATEFTKNNLGWGPPTAEAETAKFKAQGDVAKEISKSVATEIMPQLQSTVSKTTTDLVSLYKELNAIEREEALAAKTVGIPKPPEEQHISQSLQAKARELAAESAKRLSQAAGNTR